MSIESRVKEIRTVNSLKQKDFGETIGLSLMNVSDIERGKVKASTEIIQKISKQFGVSPAWLLTGEGEMFLPTEEEKKAKEKPSLDSLLVTRDDLDKAKEELELRLRSATEGRTLSEIEGRTLSVVEGKADKLELEELRRELEILQRSVYHHHPEEEPLPMPEEEPEEDVPLPDYSLVAAAGPPLDLDAIDPLPEPFMVRESLLPQNREGL
ncbi:MAG: helix-turn-helix transcriptional regulator, partial [Spirochaetota bacterium]